MKSEIKVLHVVTRADMGGISSLLYNYYSNMQDSNITFHIVAIGTDYIQGHQKIFEKLGMKVFFMPEKINRRLAYLGRLIKSEKYAVVHAHVELVSAIYLSIALWRGIKVRIAHTHLAVKNKGLKNKLLKLLLNLVVTHRIGCSKMAIARLFGKKYSGRSTVLSNAIDPSAYQFDYVVRKAIREELHLSDSYVVGFVGRLTALKNIPYLLDVFKALKDTVEEAVLLFVGDGEQRKEIEVRVAELGIGNAVRFCGMRSDVKKLLMGMDVLLLPSFSEGFGMVLIEAQAAALKCVTSLNRVPKETCISSYIHYEALDQPASVWADLIKKECISYERIDMARVVGIHHFDVRIEADKLIEFYNRVV